jgi:hypothetical protein
LQDVQRPSSEVRDAKNNKRHVYGGRESVNAQGLRAEAYFFRYVAALSDATKLAGFFNMLPRRDL